MTVALRADASVFRFKIKRAVMTTQGKVMKAGEFLQRSRQQLIKCRPGDTLETAAKLLHTYKIGAMPVCGENLRIVGILSERDLVRAFATQGSDLRRMFVRDVMSQQVVSCNPEEPMQAAQDVMRRNRFRHLPVVANGQVLGMLSIRDTLATRLQESELEINVLREVVVAARYR